MATITLTIDNTQLTAIANALAWKGGWTPTVPDGAGGQITNPLTKNAFAKQQLINYTMSTLADYQALQAQQAITPPAGAVV